MIDLRVEGLANDVREAMSATMPVDPFAIAKEEGIRLGGGTFGESFSGRIEYHPRRGLFLLFHPLHGNQNRIRFSVAHELGHYYIDEHRHQLMAGMAHNSNAGFVCDSAFEREADEFAAALLIPRQYIEGRSRSVGFMTLAKILQMARDCRASITCAAIRYARYTEEACAAVLSCDGKVLYGISSDEMGAVGFRVIKRGTPVPTGSATAKCQSAPGLDKVVEGRTRASLWFANKYRDSDLWEECIPLGYLGQCLTLLSCEADKEEQEQ